MSPDKKVVVAADDDLDTLNIIATKLEPHNITVHKARDGQQALNFFREHNPDLVILDVMMPKISGFKVARMLKFGATSKTIPLILLTARTQDTDASTGKEVGADLYLTKPVDPEQLLKEVKRLLGLDA